MLEVINLDFDYPEKNLLHDIQFSVNPGCLLHLRGGNGAGKTTLLKLLAGILQPSQGDIRYDGRPIKDDLASYQQSLCYLGHKTGVSQSLTVKENCRFELSRNPCSPCLAELLPALGLQGLEDIACGLLSVGQRRRVAMSRLLISKAPLWLLDEPLVALDVNAVAILMNLLNKHLQTGGLVILSSHQSLPWQPDDYQEYCL